jgi:hypothetical protein
MKKVFVWQLLAVGNLVDFRTWCLAAGIGEVIVKVADGTHPVNQATGAGQAPDGPLVTLKAVLAAGGIQMGGYQYTYGNDPVREGKIAGERIRTLGLSTFVIDAEGEWERVTDPPTRALQYMQALNSSTPKGCRIALSSFRFTKGYHDAFPFKQFMAGCDEVWPQVYWMGAHNAGEQLKRSVADMRAVRNIPVVPVGAAYHEGDFTPTVAEMKDFDDTAHALGLTDIAWWAADDHGLLEHPEWYAFLCGTKWGTPPVPPVVTPPAPPILTDAVKLERLVAAHPELFPDLPHPAPGTKVSLPVIRNG